MRGRALLTLLLLSALAFSGCTDDAPADDTPTPPGPAPTHTVDGRVLTPAFNPIEGARVWLAQSGHCTADGECTKDLSTVEDTTDATGAFALPEIWEGNNTTIHVEHADYEDTNVTVPVPGPAINVTIAPIDRVVPFQQQFPFAGYIECGAEYFIISPSCDSVITAGGGPELFQTDSTFAFQAEDDWATLIVDTWFDDEGHPGIAGLRLSGYTANASSELGEYQRFIQAVGEAPFTVRIEPGAEYDQALPAPEGAAGFEMEYFPHGHGDDMVCDPSGTCFLGAGAAFRLEFEAVATVFYHEAAPDGWTLLDD